LQSSYTTGWNVFLAKLNPAGDALVYSTYLGGSCGRSVVVDSSGNAYVTGHAEPLNFPVVNAFQPVSGGYLDAFVTKLDPTGSALVYSTFLGGSNDDTGNAISVDSSGNAYVTGTTFSTDFPTAGPLQPGRGGNGSEYVSDAFITKLQ
jgi:hypothetical protein